MSGANGSKIYDPTVPQVKECPWATAAVPEQTAKGVQLKMVRGPCNDRCSLYRDGGCGILSGLAAVAKALGAKVSA